MPFKFDDDIFKNTEDLQRKVIKDSLNDIGDFLISQGKRSFVQRKFNNRKWKRTILPSKSKGRISRSLDKEIIRNSVTVKSDLIYSGIQNRGGRIRVTEKMKKFFWSKYYETNNVIWKRMALTNKRYIKIPQRQFLGITNELNRYAEAVLLQNFKKHLG